MRVTDWLTKETFIAATFVFAANAASAATRYAADQITAPMHARTAIDENVERHVLDRTGEVVDCRGPRRGPFDWTNTSGLRVCFSASDNLRVPLNSRAGGTETFRAFAYTGTLQGNNYAVMSAQANRLIRLHEGRHLSRQPLPNATSSSDRIIGHSYGEADAFLTEIIAAYQNYLQTGETEEWEMINTRAPLMVRVFDTLVAANPHAQAALRRGERPNNAILRQTAASYLFSPSAQNYLQNFYREAYPDLSERLAEGAINFSTRDLNRWLHFDNRPYLVTQRGQQFNPLDRWLLAETLGLALPKNLQEIADAYTRQHQELSDQITDSEEGSPLRAALEQRQASLERNSPTSRAWRAAGLEVFRETAPVLTAPTVPAPLTRVNLVVLHDETDLAVAPTPVRPRGQVPRPCSLYVLAKTGRC